MQRLVHALATRIVRHRAVLLVVFGGLALVAAAQLPRLETDPSPEGLVASHDEQAVLSEALREELGHSDRALVLLVQAPDVLEPEPLDYVHRLSRRFAEAPWVASVESLTLTPVLRPNDTQARPTRPTREIEAALVTLAEAEPERFPEGPRSVAARLAQLEGGPLVTGERVDAADARRVREALGEAPLIEGRLVSRSRRVTAVMVELRGEDHRERAEAVDRVEAWLGANPPPEGVSVSVGGLPVIRRALARGIESDQLRLLPLTALVCAVLMFLAFRWIGGILASLVTVGIAAALVVGAMASVGLPMNVLTEVLPMLLVVIGVTDAIHLVSRYREELRQGHDRRRAGRRTVHAMAVACFFTSVTTAVGLGALAVSRTAMLREFGLLAAAGVLVTYVVVIGFLPAALTVLRAPRSEALRGDRLGSAVTRVTGGVLRRRALVLAIAVVAVGLAAWSALGVEVDSRLLDPFDPDDPAAVAVRLMEAELEGARPLEVLIRSESPTRWQEPEVLETVDRSARWLERQPSVLSTMSASGPLHELWALLVDDPEARGRPFRSREQVSALTTLIEAGGDGPLDAFVGEGGRVLRLRVMMADVGARESAGVIEALRERLRAELPPGSRVAMTGEAYAGSLAVESVVRDLSGSLLLAVAVIFGILTLLFGSVRLGLASIPPNLIPLVLTAAWMRWRGIPLDIATGIIFSVGLGLAVDATIHVLARFREERDAGRSPDEALLASAQGTGRAVVVSTTTLALGFSVLAMSELVPVRRFGELVAVTVASCLVATLVVLPPLLSLVGGHRRRREAPAPAE